MEITKDEFTAWKENKVTQHVISMIEEAIAADKEYLAAGGTISEGGYPTEFIVGRIQGANVFLNVEYEEPSADYDH